MKRIKLQQVISFICVITLLTASVGTQIGYAAPEMTVQILFLSAYMRGE